MSKALEKKLSHAQTYSQWKEAAINFDKHNGLQQWKELEPCTKYDHAAIRSRLDKLKAFRKANDNHGLLFALNEGIHGNLGGMGNASLYQTAKFGTKRLIVAYIDEVASALEHLSQPKVTGVSEAEKIDFFRRASLCFGRSALLMSGSGTYLFYHIGVIKALWQQDLIPEVLSGASGGAFVAAVVGTRSHEELAEIFDPDFIALEDDLKEVLDRSLLIKKVNTTQNDLQTIVEKLVPDLTFSEAYERSGIQINISITPAETHQKSRLLNAVTSPNVMIREAVMASASIPGIFAPVTLAAKNVNNERVPYLPSRKWVDGSLSDDLPMKRLSRLYGVNHYIVSQTNPMVLPFVSGEKSSSGIFATIGSTATKTMKDWGLAAGYILQKPFPESSYMSKVLNGYISIVSQSYTGDINILPSNRFLNPTKIIAARSNIEIQELIHDGESATWPAMERIRLQTKISRRLWNIVRELESRSISPKTKKRLKAVGSR